MKRFVDIALAIGAVLLFWAVLTQDLEKVTEGLITIAAAVLWDFMHERRITGADLIKRWRP